MRHLLPIKFFDYSYNGKSSKATKPPKVDTLDTKAINTTSVEPESVSEEKIEAKVSKTVEETTKTENDTKEVEAILYAQPIDNGFQVIDTEPKKVMILLYSGVPDTFIVEGKDAIVYKKENGWIYAENNGKSLISRGINLKF